MSQSPPPENENKDVKPKVRLPRSFTSSPLLTRVSVTSFSKLRIFLTSRKQKFNKQAGTFKFTYDGTRVKPDDTPAGLGMEDGDQIDAFLEQLGGGPSCSR
ncbi:hypothetical protein EV122DRAFT_272498 [Schizophyllum commune]